MAANKFKISGSPVEVSSFDEFIAQEHDGVFENVLYLPDYFNPDSSKVLKQKEKKYKNISFKDTTFENVSFVYCEFYGCLLLSSKFINCEFIDCRFIETNTNKAQFSNTLIDPAYFKGNFDLKLDTNIAADLYHSLYKNLSNERQPDRARQSLYMMHRAENAHLNSQLKRDKISQSFFLWNKLVHAFNCVTSGYGLKLYRVLITLMFVVVVFSGVNYFFSVPIF